MSAFIYILKCSDNSYYTGSTRSIELRLDQHKTGKGSKYTSSRLPIELVYLEEFPRIDEAFYREKQVQGWSRKKKEALMNNDWQSLHELAMCKNASITLSNPDSHRLRSGQATTLNTLGQKDRALSQKDNTLSQKDNTLSQKDSTLSQKDSALSQKDSTLSQKGRTLSQKGRTLSQKGRTLSQKSNTLGQKSNTLGQKGGALSGVEGYDGTETYPTQNSIKKDKT